MNGHRSIPEWSAATAMAMAAMLFAPLAEAECDTGSYRSDPHQCLQPRPIALGSSGASIEHILDRGRLYCYTGTLGALVTGTDANGSFHDYILSNNHVLAKENEPDNSLSPDGREIIQPGLLDEGPCSSGLGEPNNVVGYLTGFVPLLFGKGANLPDNVADAAMAEVVAGTVDPSGAIVDIGTLTGPPVPASLNMKVQKSGRTTAHTFGEVVATDVTVNVRYGSGTARFVGQLEIVGLCGTNFSDSGDSGSLVVNLPDAGNAHRAAVGLLFAGGGSSTFANPIDVALSTLQTETGVNGLMMVHDGTGTMPDDAANAPICDPPATELIAQDDNYSLPKKNDALTVGPPGVLENDSGYDGGPVVVVDAGPSHGNVVLRDDGSFDYTYQDTDRNGDGTDSFVYSIGNDAETATAIVTINLASGGGRPFASAREAAFERVRAIKTDNDEALFRITGVHGTGIGSGPTGDPVIRVYVERPAQAADSPIPADIEGIPVQVVVTGPIVAR
jgi:hypothetical protein